MRPHRSEAPAIYWMAIGFYGCMTGILALFGFALVVWGVVMLV
jgi:hypothetical protein